MNSYIKQTESIYLNFRDEVWSFISLKVVKHYEYNDKDEDSRSEYCKK